MSSSSIRNQTITSQSGWQSMDVKGCRANHSILQFNCARSLLVIRQAHAQRPGSRMNEAESCGCTRNWDPSKMKKCNKIMGKIIHTHTHAYTCVNMHKHNTRWLPVKWPWRNAAGSWPCRRIGRNRTHMRGQFFVPARAQQVILSSNASVTKELSVTWRK